MYTTTKYDLSLHDVYYILKCNFNLIALPISLFLCNAFPLFLPITLVEIFPSFSEYLQSFKSMHACMLWGALRTKHLMYPNFF